jgi:rubrerythrin
MKRLQDLSEPEILALAIASEEEDARIYRHFALRLREAYPASGQVFDAMAVEEDGHRRALLDLYERKFGTALPYITRQDVRGFLRRRPVWLMQDLRLDVVRGQAALMEHQAASFYVAAASQATDVEVRRLLGDLAQSEQNHEKRASELEQALLPPDARQAEDAQARRALLLQVVQPGLAGLIDGSISTGDAFLVGLAASIGAGISMGLTEALSDDGQITGRGHPWVRGAVCGVMTALGGLGHTLPYLIPDFWTATAVAGVVVAIELFAISWIRWKYMETPFGNAFVQVVLGGILVLLTGIFIGSA